VDPTRAGRFFGSARCKIARISASERSTTSASLTYARPRSTAHRRGASNGWCDVHVQRGSCDETTTRLRDPLRSGISGCGDKQAPLYLALGRPQYHSVHSARRWRSGRGGGRGWGRGFAPAPESQWAHRAAHEHHARIPAARASPRGSRIGSARARQSSCDVSWWRVPRGWLR
jgi:hypothetical protein